MNKFLSAMALLVGVATSSSAAPTAPQKAEPAKPMVSATVNLDSADGVISLPFKLAADKSGKAMVCAYPIMGVCPDSRLVTPEQAIKALYPKATYLGFRLVRSEGIDRLAIYYKTN